MTRPKTGEDLRAEITRQIDAHGLNATARALGVYSMTLYRVLTGLPAPDSILAAFNLERRYRNGTAKAITEAELRAKAQALVTRHGGFHYAGQALGLSASTLFYFASGRTPAPSPRVLQALGYDVVYVPTK